MKDAKKGGNAKYGKKSVWHHWDTSEKNMAFKLALVWQLFCFVFVFFAMYLLSGPAGQTAFFLLFSVPKL